jgi:hypothetical protein
MRSYYEAIEQCQEAVQLELYRAISLYGLNRIEPQNMSPLSVTLWTLIKPLLDKQWTKFDNGKKGGTSSEAMKGNQNARKRTENEPKTNRKQTGNKATLSMIEDKGYRIEDIGEGDTTTSVVDNSAPNGASSSKDDSIDYGALISFFNSTLEQGNSVIRPIRDISGKRRDSVRARVRESGKQSLVAVFKKASISDFLNGKNDRGFIATFDWLVSPNNFIKVLEGNYDNRVIKNREDDWLKEYEERQAREEEERQRSKAGAVDHDEFLKLKEEGKI